LDNDVWFRVGVKCPSGFAGAYALGEQRKERAHFAQRAAHGDDARGVPRSRRRPGRPRWALPRHVRSSRRNSPPSTSTSGTKLLDGAESPHRV